MVQKPSKVERFLDKIVDRVLPQAKKELKALEEMKRMHTKDESAKLEPEDMLYYKDMMKLASGVDEQEISQYFPINHVVETTMEIYHELLGLTFEKVDCKAWVEDVICYRVYDTDSEELRGLVYLDIFERKGKGQVAQVNDLCNRHNLGDN
jgi:Zn-dependent oligopeptidase